MIEVEIYVHMPRLMLRLHSDCIRIFRCRDDVLEIQKILGENGIDINVIAPLGASPASVG